MNTLMSPGVMLKKTEQAKTIHYPLLVLTLLITVGLFLIALARIRIDTDVVGALPDDGGSVAAAVDIFKHHPIQDQIAIDIGLENPDRDRLVQISRMVESGLRQSGLFEGVGLDEIHQSIPALMTHVVEQLPSLFTAEELQRQVLPLVAPRAIEARFESMYHRLIQLQGIGQAEGIARDPLGLRELKLLDLSSLAPSQNARIYKGKLLSADGRHLLVVARPAGSGTDTAYAQEITALIQKIQADVNSDQPRPGARITLTPVGAYRAALDNEVIIRKDVRNAVVFATLGITLLLFLAFPRPLIGVMALLPAIAGTVTAFFVYSLFQESISIMALGFGGAIISITVDHGIAYLLFLDRPCRTFGKDASREVWAVGLLAALTTAGAFAVLGISGFPILAQLGGFTAMGIVFSFLFVHSAFPLIFRQMPPAPSGRRPLLKPLVDRLAGFGTKGAWAVLMVGGVLLFWANPRFNVDLSTMNTVSESTRSAEQLLTDVWGNVLNRVYVMTEADSLVQLQAKNDRLLSMIEAAKASGEVASGFLPSQVFPGSSRRETNLSAWRSFWDAERVAAVRGAFAQAAAKWGFKADAFEPFFRTLSADHPDLRPVAIPREYFGILGIAEDPKDGTWRQFAGIATGPHYDAALFYSRFQGLAKVFEPEMFSGEMGRLLFHTFGRMLLIIGVSAVVLLFFFFADWQLTLIALVPIGFAFVATLGTLGLTGRSLDIPALMLTIIILGVGIDYSLFFVRSYQRYQQSSHPYFGLIRMSVFMASASTMIGFGVLCTAHHSMLRSAGITSFLGIGYSLIGAFVMLPPLLRRRFEPAPEAAGDRPDGDAQVLWRYRNMEAYPRMFARFKLRLDPMFAELKHILPADRPIHTIMDIGSGYGVPGCWLLSRYPGARIYGIEPCADRVRVASLAVGKEGTIIQGLAPEVPQSPASPDLAFMLDMCHFLDDQAFELTLSRIRDRMESGGQLIARVVLVPARRWPWSWWVENLKMKINGIRPYYRSEHAVAELVGRVGFSVESVRPSGTLNELAWVVARLEKERC